MIVNQHTILATPRNGFYEEYVLDSEETGTVLPGACLTLKSTANPQADGIATAVLTSQVPSGGDIDTVEFFVVIENALLGKSINHKAYTGEVTPVYRPVSGDRFLARAVAGSYVEGDPLYLVQTANGLYFTKAAGAGGGEVKAFAAESFVVQDATNLACNPKFYYDVVDDSTTERPSSVNMNGGVVNLLRVRIA